MTWRRFLKASRAARAPRIRQRKKRWISMITRDAMHLETLKQSLRSLKASTIAVSGGIDSLTLVVVAYQHVPDSKVYHAVSPAVPQSATQRVRDYAKNAAGSLRCLMGGVFRRVLSAKPCDQVLLLQGEPLRFDCVDDRFAYPVRHRPG